MVEFNGEPVDVLDDSSALQLEREYGILLVNGDTGTWTQEHAYRLLETMKAIPRHYWITGQGRWALTSAHVPNDIWITGGGVQDNREVLIAEDAFTYASPRTATIDGKRGQYFSRRLHHAAVRYVTDNGNHGSSYDKILRERYGVTTFVTDDTTYRALTASTTGETAAQFQDFHAEEIVQLINAELSIRNDSVLCIQRNPKACGVSVPCKPQTPFEKQQTKEGWHQDQRDTPDVPRDRASFALLW